ncbi:MAG: SGNH/GDSL hydrolase family protein [Deltaproteobacteria bacterium]|nr:SGNH/GDSL hydrolase family protein [Deltaproteobacteria bacterium]
MKRFLMVLALCGLLLISGFVPVGGQADAATRFDNLVVYGDSLSDSGNVFLLAQGQAPDPANYWQGRWSNGPVWSEDLAGLMGLSDNLILSQLITQQAPPPVFGSLFFNNAFGGAKTGAGAQMPVVDFLDQVNQAMAAQVTIPQNTLVAVWIGANDFLSADLSTQEQVAAVIGNAINNIYTGLTRLVDNMGATDIAVFDLPDLGATPRNNGTPEGAAQGRAVSQAFNDALAQALGGFAATHPGVNIYPISSFELFDKALAYPGLYGFTNTDDSALLSGKTFDNAGGYIFWDTIHPTAQTHRMLAATVYGDLFINEPNASYIMTDTGKPLGIVSMQGIVSDLDFADPYATPQTDRPSNMIYGLMDVDLTSVFGTAVFKVVLPEALPRGYSWFKLNNGKWLDFAMIYKSTAGQEGAQISKDRKSVTIVIKDNGPFDSNLAVGQVSDPLAAGLDTSYDDGGDGVCFISSLFG